MESASYQGAFKQVTQGRNVLFSLTPGRAEKGNGGQGRPPHKKPAPTPSRRGLGRGEIL